MAKKKKKQSTRFEVKYDTKTKKGYKIYEDGRKERVHLYADHPKPMTRRDFLNAGITNSVAMIAAPSILNLLTPKVARAEGGPRRVNVMYIFGSGGPSWHELTEPRKSNGDLINVAGRQNLGIFSNLNASGTVDTQYGAPLVRTTPFYATLFERNRGVAQTRLLGDQTNYAWDQVSDAVRDRVLSRTSINFAAVQTPDDASGNNAKLAIGPAVQLLMKGGAPTFLESGVTARNLYTATGVRANSISIIQSAPPFLAARDERSVREAVGNPCQFQRCNDAQSAAAARGMSRFVDWQGGLGKVLAPLLNKNSANIAAAGQLDLNPATVLTPSANAILGSLNPNDGIPLASCFTTIFQDVTVRLVCWSPNNGDHHSGADYLNDSVAYGRRIGKAIAAFLVECEARGEEGIVVGIGGGGMKGRNPGQDPDTGLTTGWSSDEGRKTDQFCILFNPAGRETARYATLGSHQDDTGFASPEGIGGNAENAATVGTIAIAARLYPANWQDKLKSVVSPRTLGALGIPLADANPWRS